jgi:hypothetical protein
MSALVRINALAAREGREREALVREIYPADRIESV